MRSEVIVALTMKITLFCSVMSCSLVDRHRHLEGTYCLQLHSAEAYCARFEVVNMRDQVPPNVTS